jgi:endonuclease III
MYETVMLVVLSTVFSIPRDRVFLDERTLRIRILLLDAKQTTENIRQATRDLERASKKWEDVLKLKGDGLSQH